MAHNLYLEGSSKHTSWQVPAASPCTDVRHVPNLVLQEVHVPVKQGIGRREDAHGLHACATLQLALHRHVGEAGQAEEGPFPEIAKIDQRGSVARKQTDTSCCFVFSFERQTPRKEITMFRVSMRKLSLKKTLFLESQGNN